MKKNIYFIIVFSLSLLQISVSSCGQQKSKEQKPNLVGNSKDDHGCLTSAGYRWSEAKKDCVRIWEVGTKVESGDKHLFVVFSPDSLHAEIFGSDGKQVMCVREDEPAVWNSDTGKEVVKFTGKLLEVSFEEETYQSDK